MHELREKLEKVEDLEEKLISWVSEEADKGKHSFDTKEAGEAIDMIKDLAEAKEKCWKACYYKSIVEAMEEWEEEEEGRAGYDAWRYPSSGRYASKGHGVRYGYIPNPPYYFDWEKDHDDKMGYVKGSRHRNMPRGRMGYIEDGDGNMMYSGKGEAYDRYMDSKRHYTETHSKKDKDEMDEHAKEHIAKATDTFREIWAEADTDLKRKMKQDLTSLVGEMII